VICIYKYENKLNGTHKILCNSCKIYSSYLEEYPENYFNRYCPRDCEYSKLLKIKNRKDFFNNLCDMKEVTIKVICYDLGLEENERIEFDAIKKSIEIYKLGKTLLKKRKCGSCGQIINRRLPDSNSILAASIYIAAILAGQHITQKKIKEYFNVDVVTLRKHYKKIMNLPEYKNEDKIIM